MNPFLFGSRDRQLFGVYHPATGRRRRMGSVICAPLGKEYLRSHRALRLLAERLSSQGVDVLRFDYFGTGDSGGEGEEVSLAGCVADAQMALDEVRALAGVRDLAVIGLRLGAAIGLSAATAQGVQRVVLWDPVSHGPDYLAELLSRTGRGSPEHEFARGFPLPARLQDELRGLTPETLTFDVKETLLVISQDLPQHLGLLEHMRTTVSVQFEPTTDRPAWVEELELGVGAVPADILQRIVEWVCRASS